MLAPYLYLKQNWYKKLDFDFKVCHTIKIVHFKLFKKKRELYHSSVINKPNNRTVVLKNFNKIYSFLSKMIYE